MAKLPIEEDKKIILDSDKRVEFKPHGVYLTRFENCKGLEFAKVYIVENDPLKNNDALEARKSFVGVTRAMDDLKIYYLDK